MPPSHLIAQGQYQSLDLLTYIAIFLLPEWDLFEYTIVLEINNTKINMQRKIEVVSHKMQKII